MLNLVFRVTMTFPLGLRNWPVFMTPLPLIGSASTPQLYTKHPDPPAQLKSRSAGKRQGGRRNLARKLAGSEERQGWGLPRRWSSAELGVEGLASYCRQFPPEQP